MSLGILRIAAVLEKAGHAVEVVDLSGIDNFTEAIQVHAKGTDAQIFGVTATTPQMPSAARVIRAIRGARPDARIILGGPHPTLTHAAMKKEVARNVSSGRALRAMVDMENLADVIVAGDGETGIFEAIKWGAGMTYKNRIVDADDMKSPLFMTNEILNELPLPARHLVDVSSYHYKIDGEPALSMIAQLGCPFQCGFCGGRASPMLRRVRTRSTENVVAEMRHLYLTYGTKGFMLYDDELNVNPQMIQMMEAIADEQQRLGVEFKLRGFIKSQLFTPAQAKAMYRAGFRWILTGFESGSERILTNINKRATRDENTQCVRIAHDNGLKVKALMSMGHPGESMQTVEDTKSWLLENKPEDFDVTIITPYPGSPYYDDAVPVLDKPGDWVYTYARTGDRLYSQEVDYLKVADYYKGDPNGGYKSYVYTDFLSKEELVSQRDHLEQEVRSSLGIPFYPAQPAARFEHSMGQMGLPSTILRRSLVSQPS